MKKILSILLILFCFTAVAQKPLDILQEKNTAFSNIIGDWILKYKHYSPKINNQTQYEKLEYSKTDTISVLSDDSTIAFILNTFFTEDYLIRKATPFMSQIKTNDKFISCQTANSFTEINLLDSYLKNGINIVVINYYVKIIVQ